MRRPMGGETSTERCAQASHATERSRHDCFPVSYAGDPLASSSSLRCNPWRGDCAGDALVASSLHVDRVVDRWSRPGDAANFGYLHRHAQRDCRPLYSKILLPREQCIYDPDCLYIADGAGEFTFPSLVYRLPKGTPCENTWPEYSTAPTTIALVTVWL